MRIRTVKPEYWPNEALSSVSEAAALLSLALLNYADDEGFFNARAELIKGACFPLRELSVSIQCALTELSNIGFIELRIVDGKTLGRVVKFREHQRINRPTKSKIRPLWGTRDDEIKREITEHSLNTHGGLTEDSPQEGNREQGKEQGTGNRETRETSNGFTVDPNEIAAHFVRGGGTEEQAKRFWNHYDSIGWTVRGSPIRQWRSLANKWIEEDRHSAAKGRMPKAKRPA